MANSDTILYTPDQNSVGNVLPWMLAANNGLGGFGGGLLPGMMLGSGMGWGGFGGFGGGGLATGGIGFLLGLLFGNGTFGNAFGGGGSGAGFLSNQIDNNAGRELLMNAINANGEASRAAVQNLSTMLGQDFNLVNADVEAIKSGLSSLALQQAVSVPQIVNAIQAGNSDMALQLCKCCCEQRQLTVEQGYQNQLRTVEQTNALGGAIAGASQRNVDAIADLKTTVVDQFCQLERRELQDKITSLTANNALLRSQIDNANQTAQIAALVAPIAKEVDDIKCKLPNTVSVPYPQLSVVNNTPNIGGYYGPYGYGYGAGSGNPFWGGGAF